MRRDKLHIPSPGEMILTVKTPGLQTNALPDRSRRASWQANPVDESDETTQMMGELCLAKRRSSARPAPGPKTFEILNSPDASSDLIESASTIPTPSFRRTATLIDIGPSR